MGVVEADESLDELARVGGPRCLALVDMRRIKALSREARDRFKERTPSICARVAMLIGSPVGRVLGNFFFRHVTAGMPKQLFTSEEEAVVWLLKES